MQNMSGSAWAWQAKQIYLKKMLYFEIKRFFERFTNIQYYIF